MAGEGKDHAAALWELIIILRELRFCSLEWATGGPWIAAEGEDHAAAPWELGFNDWENHATAP